MQTNPRWGWFEKIKGKVNWLIRNFRYNENGFELVYNTFIREEFPATLMIVGKLFHPIESPEFIEWGSHTINHLPLTLTSDEKLEKETENAHKLKSFVAPMWMIEDVRNPERIFKVLKKKGFSHCVYRGKNKGAQHFHYNAVKKPVKKTGVTCVHVSDWFEGNWSKRRINEIKTRILSQINEEKVYLLTTHDFSHRNNKNLLNIIRFLKRLEKEKKIKLMGLKDIK